MEENQGFTGGADASGEGRGQKEPLNERISNYVKENKKPLLLLTGVLVYALAGLVGEMGKPKPKEQESKQSFSYGAKEETGKGVSGKSGVFSQPFDSRVIGANIDKQIAQARKEIKIHKQEIAELKEQLGGLENMRTEEKKQYAAEKNALEAQLAEREKALAASMETKVKDILKSQGLWTAMEGDSAVGPGAVGVGDSPRGRPITAMTPDNFNFLVGGQQSAETTGGTPVSNNVPEAATQSEDVFIAAGSYVPVVIVQGADIGIYGQHGVTNCVVTGDVLSAMGMKIPGKGWTIVADCEGVLSEEAIKITGAILTYGLPGGKLGEVTFQGMLVDNRTNKMNVSGKVKNKVGSVILKNIAANVLTGLASGYAGTSVEQVDSLHTGTTTSRHTGSKLKASLLSGGESGAKKASEYYQKQADAVYPVIELKSGIKGHMLITKGFTLPGLKREYYEQKNIIDSTFE